MNLQRKHELISAIERAFPTIAEILRQRPLESLRDRLPNGKRYSPDERTRRRQKLRLIRKNVCRLRAERLASGLCRDCGKACCEDSKIFCAPHLARRRKYARKSDKKKREKGGVNGTTHE